LLPLLQETLVCDETVPTKTAGWFTVADAVVVHPFASVMVTV
jgi:hypothetical protein